MTLRKVYIGTYRCKVNAYLVVLRCYKCQGLRHVAKIVKRTKKRACFVQETIEALYAIEKKVRHVDYVKMRTRGTTTNHTVIAHCTKLPLEA